MEKLDIISINTGVLCIVYYERFDDTKDVVNHRQHNELQNNRTNDGLVEHYTTLKIEPHPRPHVNPER